MTKNKAKLAVGLIVAPFAIVPLVWILLQRWMAYVAHHSTAPDQGAMVLAFLILCAFILAGIISFLVGLVLYIQSFRS